MNPISVRLDPDTVAELDAEADAKGVSRNAHLIEIIGRRNEYSDLRSEYKQLQSKAAELRKENRHLETEVNALREAQQADTEERREMVSENQRLQAQVERLQKKEDQHEMKLTAANSRQDDLGEIVEYVEDERSLAQRREERRNAPAWKRAKWWLFGTPVDEQAETAP